MDAIVSQVGDLNISDVEYTEIFKGILSEDVYEIQQKTIQLRKLLSVQNCEPVIKKIIEWPDLGSKLVQLSYMTHFPAVQLESMWIISNMASTDVKEYNQYVLDIGALPSLVHSMKSGNVEIALQAVWGVGNIIGATAEYRDMALDLGLIANMETVWQNHKPNIDLATELSRLLSNVLSIKPPVSNEIVEQLLPTLLAFLLQNNQLVLKNTIWSISYIAEDRLPGSGNIIYGENDTYGVVRKALDFASYYPNDKTVVLPVIRTIGNIIAMVNNGQTMNLLKAHSKALFSLFTHALESKLSRSIVKEVCWIISNIMVTHEFIEIGINSGILKTVLDSQIIRDQPSMSDDNGYISNEIFWIIYNIFDASTEKQFTLIVKDYNLFGFMMMWLHKRSKEDFKKEKLSIRALENLVKVMSSQFTRLIKPHLSTFTQTIHYMDVINQLTNCDLPSISDQAKQLKQLLQK